MGLDKVKNLFTPIMVVILAFSGGWYYLEQKRLSTSKELQKATILKIKTDIRLQQYQKWQNELQKKEKTLESKFKEQSRDKELSNLTLMFINELSAVDLRQCGDDEEHNRKVRKAKALLSLIEAKAIEYGRLDIVNVFVKRQQLDIGGWSAKCKS